MLICTSGGRVWAESLQGGVWAESLQGAGLSDQTGLTYMHFFAAPPFCLQSLVSRVLPGLLMFLLSGDDWSLLDTPLFFFFFVKGTCHPDAAKGEGFSSLPVDCTRTQ